MLRAHGYECRFLPPAHRRIGQTWHDNDTEWRQAVATLFHSLRQNTGLLAFNDCLAGRVLAAAHDVGVHVPRQLAVIGVGNDVEAHTSSLVDLTSIDVDWEHVARRAVDLLDTLLQGRASPYEPVLIPPRAVITRGSTGVDPWEHSYIRQATAYISEHCSDSRLGVERVAEQVGISRRQLERNFRSLKHCTVRAFIEDTRMLMAARLLVEQPRAKIMVISELIGITDPNSFYRKFRLRFGVTPTAFRRKQAALPNRI